MENYQDEPSYNQLSKMAHQSGQNLIELWLKFVQSVVKMGLCLGISVVSEDDHEASVVKQRLPSKLKSALLRR